MLKEVEVAVPEFFFINIKNNKNFNMRIKIICLLALSCSAAYAQTWSEDQEAALQELLAAKASRTRKVRLYSA